MHAVGSHQFDGLVYETVAKNITGLLPAGSVGYVQKTPIGSHGMLSMLQHQSRHRSGWHNYFAAGNSPESLIMSIS